MHEQKQDGMTEAQEERAEGREFAFTERDFRRVCELIYQRSGISLSERKQDLVYGRLARRLRATGCDSFASYLKQLEDNAHAGEWQQFTNALTTNLTAFMREAHHFSLLREHLLAARRDAMVSVWSAAASTGEEAYSIAMTAWDALGEGARRVRILATDIDTAVLETGRQGVYPIERIESVPEAWRQTCFLRGKGEREGLVRVRDPLREMISFRQLNLLAGWPMRRPFDVVFCRNVLIYFDKPTQRRLMRRMARQIIPGGLLFIGHSESLVAERELFELIGKTAYRRTSQRAPADEEEKSDECRHE